MHLVGEHEPHQGQEVQLREPRPAWGPQRQQHHRGHGQQQAGEYGGVEPTRRAVDRPNPVERVPGDVLQHEPQRVPVGRSGPVQVYEPQQRVRPTAAVRREGSHKGARSAGEQLRPRAGGDRHQRTVRAGGERWRRDVRRQAGEDHRRQRGSSSERPRSQPVRPQAEGQQRHEEQRRVELRRRRQPEQDAGQYRSAPSPGQHRQAGQRGGGQVPVGHGVYHQGGRERQHGGVPAPPAGQQRGGPNQREGGNGQLDPGQPVERRIPLGDRPPPCCRRRRRHHGPDADRVLHRHIDVRRAAGDQPLAAVQRDDVGVAQQAILPILRPQPISARRLLRPGQRHGQEREREQHPQWGPPPNRRLGMPTGQPA